MRKALVAAAVVSLVTASTLVGCVGRGPVVTLPPSPTTTPVFASDEEALAAAEAAYGEYLRVSDLIASEGGANPERIVPYVTEEQLPSELATYKFFADNDLHASGNTEFEAMKLQSLDQPGPEAEIRVYLCGDVSRVRILDSSGTDVTPADRPARTLLEVGFVTVSSKAVVSSSSVWSGDASC